jgi:hypothetical protein
MKCSNQRFRKAVCSFSVTRPANRSGLANRPLHGRLRLGMAMYLDRYVCLNSLDRDSQDSCRD